MNKHDWLTKLIAFDTTSRNSNLPLIDFMANTLDDYQLKSIIIHDDKELKANLLATIPAQDNRIEGGLILSGHTDVVPVDGQIWDSDPFQATIKDERIYGRGTCDMKGFIAVVMSLIPQLKSLKLDFPIHLAFSYDEEIGCRGAPYLIDKIKMLHYKPKACIVGEPTSMQPVIGHKGIHSYRCKIHGVAAHSSLTSQGCNAIEHGAALIGFLRNLANQFKATGHKDELYDVPYTSVSTNLIHGGNAYNTIPNLCEFIFEIRNLAADNANEIHEKIVHYIEKELLPCMQQEQAGARITLENIATAPGLDTPTSAAIVQAVQAICQNPKQAKVAYATEAGLYQQAQIPTLVCGPGSIEQAHRANEFVALEQLELCEQFIMNIIKSPLLN